MTLDDSMIITAFGAMGAVITVMWNKLSAENKRLATHFDKCDEERKKLFEEVADLRGDRELLERCPAARCPIKPANGAHVLAGLVLLALLIPAPKAQAMWPFSHAKPTACPTGCSCAAAKASPAPVVVQAAIPKPDKVIRNDVYHHFEAPPPPPPQTRLQRTMTALGPVGQILTGVAGVITASGNAVVNLAAHGLL
jgi:hypothetical protein